MESKKQPINIGGIFSILGNLIALIAEAIPDKETRRVNKAQRVIRRNKGIDIDAYVKVKFADKTPEQQQDIINLLNSIK